MIPNRIPAQIDQNEVSKRMVCVDLRVRTGETQVRVMEKTAGGRGSI